MINGYDDGLKLGFKDRLHQPYRGKLIHNYDEIKDEVEAGIISFMDSILDE